MPIVTPRLALVSWSLDDLDEAHALWGDARVMRYVGPPHADRERTRAALEAAIESERSEGFCLWRLVRRADGLGIGCAGFQRYDGPGSTRPGTRWLELAYHLHPSAWGAGYASEAAAGCVAQAPALGASHLVALVAADNRASLRIVEKLGFTLAGGDDELRFVRALA